MEILKLILDVSKQNVKDEECGIALLESEFHNWLFIENESAQSAMENEIKGSKEYSLGQFLKDMKKSGILIILQRPQSRDYIF